MSKTQLEASHEILLEEIETTIDKETNTEEEEDTPLHRKNFQKILGSISSPRQPERTKI